MNKLVKNAVKRSRSNSEYFCSSKDKKDALGTVYRTEITDRRVTVSVSIPADLDLGLDDEKALILDNEIHDAIETILLSYAKEKNNV